MSLSEATLSTQLQTLGNPATEAEAIERLAEAYGTYMEDAEALTQITAFPIVFGKANMETAMVGLNVTGNAATALAAGLTAFWATVVTSGPLAFASASAISPAAVSIAPAIQAVFDANKALNRNLVDSADALASVIHAASISGGTVTTPGPIVTPIT